MMRKMPIYQMFLPGAVLVQPVNAQKQLTIKKGLEEKEITLYKMHL